VEVIVRRHYGENVGLLELSREAGYPLGEVFLESRRTIPTCKGRHQGP